MYLLCPDWFSLQAVYCCITTWPYSRKSLRLYSPSCSQARERSDNYRPFALSPTLSKVFEWCILIQYRSAFATSPLQFGFKKGLSTDLCTGLIKNVVARYNNSDTEVFGCFLIEWAIQFCLTKKSPSSSCKNFTYVVYWPWNGHRSSKFGVSNGVGQGGVLSPILFTVYIDDLLADLQKNGVGCFWNNHFAGAVCYADDIGLLAPSSSALRHLLSTCSDFAVAHNLLRKLSSSNRIQFLWSC